MEEKKAPVKKTLFGKGIYGKKDVPIRILDGLIIGIFVVLILLVLTFAINGGYYVEFETYGDSQIERQKLDYGKKVTEPETPIRAGYEFQKWVTSEDESLAEDWNFAEDTVTGDITLYAVWEPAEIIVKFDLDGGSLDGNDQIEDSVVIFGETYGTLPVPEKEGYSFDGWEYNGNIIGNDTTVTASGEHILTAIWKK